MKSASRLSFLLKPVALLAVVGWVLLPAATFATPINHGDYEGTTIWFRDVSEDTNTTGDTPPLYGVPTVNGDSLDFSPVGFSASASGAFGVDQTDGNLFFDIQAKPFAGVESLVISEAGDTTLSGFSGDAFTSVSTNITVDILRTTAGAANITYQTTMNFTPSSGDYSLIADGGGSPLYSTNWSGGALIEFGAILAANGLAGEKATRVQVNVDNILTALSQEGTAATIAKKDFDTSGLTVEVNTDIPEPSAALLALLGVFAGGFRRRR